MPYRFECHDPDCAFLLRSSAKEEVERLVRAHVREVHDGRIAQADIDRGIERIGEEGGGQEGTGEDGAQTLK